jgi:TnpA family transposase
MRNRDSEISEAPYILDGLLMNETGRRIREQYADTGGFTDHVFAVSAILGDAFIPRIHDLPSKRLYAFEPASAPAAPIAWRAVTRCTWPAPSTAPRRKAVYIPKLF